MAVHLANGVSESRDGTVPPGGVQRERVECMSGGETRVAKAGSFDPTSGIWVEPVSWVHRQSRGKCVCVQVSMSLASSASYCPIKPGYEFTTWRLYWHANAAILIGTDTADLLQLHMHY